MLLNRVPGLPAVTGVGLVQFLSVSVTGVGATFETRLPNASSISTCTCNITPVELASAGCFLNETLLGDPGFTVIVVCFVKGEPPVTGMVAVMV